VIIVVARYVNKESADGAYGCGFGGGGISWWYVTTKDVCTGVAVGVIGATKEPR
jgi:hypothetical protein